MRLLPETEEKANNDLPGKLIAHCETAMDICERITSGNISHMAGNLDNLFLFFLLTFEEEKNNGRQISNTVSDLIVESTMILRSRDFNKSGYQTLAYKIKANMQKLKDFFIKEKTSQKYLVGV